MRERWKTHHGKRALAPLTALHQYRRIPVDPVPKNPFPEDSPGHKIWQAATIAAERDLLHFYSHLIALPEPNNYEELEERFIKSTVVQFEIWAKRDIAVVCDHETARYCAKRFHETAESKLKSFLANPPPQVRLESFLPKLRQRLLTVAEYWSALALNRAIPHQPDESSVMDANPAGPVMEPGQPKLDVARIVKWMEDEGYDNPTLAEKLKTSRRVISSIRNNGDCHGSAAVTKLANLMGCDPEELYLPHEASH